jgi:hypothetical protein
MESNRLLKKVRRNQLALIAGNYESADMVDLIGSPGLFDGVWLDMEHSPLSLVMIEDVQAIGRADRVRYGHRGLADW